jgi:hypothetical protein
MLFALNRIQMIAGTLPLVKIFLDVSEIRKQARPGADNSLQAARVASIAAASTDRHFHQAQHE